MGKTPGYAPLEQMGNDVVKFLPSTDIYALGATLYKLLTGVTPPSASLLASGEELGDMPSTISASTRNAIIAAMQTNKMKRPQCVEDFLKLLLSDVSSSSSADDEDDHTILDEEPVKPVQKPKVQEENKPKQQKEVHSSNEVEPEQPTNDVNKTAVLNALPKEKFGFWLWAFLVVLCYCGLSSIFAPLFSEYIRESASVALVIMGVMQTALAFYTLYSFVKRKSDAVFLGKLSLITICVADLVYVLCGGDGSEGIKQYAPFVRGLVTAIIWFVYLCVSKRVETVIPSFCREITKKDYIIGAVLAIFSIYLLVISLAAGTDFQTTTAGDNKETTTGNNTSERVVNQKFKDSTGETYSYTGEIQNGLPNGLGEGVYSFGRYVGPYKDGLMHGSDGKFTEKGGATFVGTFANDYYSEGTLTRTDGTYFVGRMKDGVPHKGTEYDRHGNITKQL